MQITMYGIARTSTTRAMSNLDAILDKAVASAEARKIDPAVLLGSRLAPGHVPAASARCRSPAISARARWRAWPASRTRSSRTSKPASRN